MFDDASRYKKAVEFELKDKRGRIVKVVAVPPPPLQSVMGYHLLKLGQKTDHLAARYLNNAAGFWRIAFVNEVMLAETLNEMKEIAIPNKK